MSQPLPTIHAAAADLRPGKTTPLDLLDICLERIDRYEEGVRAWVFVDWEAPAPPPNGPRPS